MITFFNRDMDVFDACPTAKETYNKFQDDDGCPDDDNNDGILDVYDDCPLVAENYNGWNTWMTIYGDGVPDVMDMCPEQSEV